jgi:RNA polymerase sigma-70 factor (ECF subfamily)
VLPDPDAADEVYQEFSLQLVHGKLGGADSGRGRFRDFVKGTLFHLIADYRAKRRRWPDPLPTGEVSLAASENTESRRDFDNSWCDEVLARAWAALAGNEDEPGGGNMYAVLRFRAEHPDMHSSQMAEQLSVDLGQPFSAVGVRQILHRARERFARLLLEEVADSMDNPTIDALEDELIELCLLEYCRTALRERRAREESFAPCAGK